MTTVLFRWISLESLQKRLHVRALVAPTPLVGRLADPFPPRCPSTHVRLVTLCKSRVLLSGGPRRKFPFKLILDARLTSQSCPLHVMTQLVRRFVSCFIHGVECHRIVLNAMLQLFITSSEHNFVHAAAFVSYSRLLSCLS